LEQFDPASVRSEDAKSRQGSLATLGILEKMDQPQRTTSPKFYKNAAILFFVIGCILVWQAIVHHDWVFGAFAGITFLNALMTTLKLISLRETKQ